ncbi:hypothetical protein [Flavobacterium proteolyticum]|uniref:Carboxypeptidase regulatory-like domain-containing protein n=1 Tax=Flavobacterium proteolyticum TaxID=2911683 RepID=A0ABR9WME2_9FLAO|nr:hypothetical protein [Flavobacterium proteolyticum]MBE9575086.1 hypothetical protein [Flavobacterium proteolyticum]
MRFYTTLFSVLYQIFCFISLSNFYANYFKSGHKCNHLLSGAIIEGVTQTPIGKVQVNLYNENNKLLKTVFTDRTGRFDFGVVTCNEIYNIKTISRFHKNALKNIIICKEDEIKECKIELTCF